MAVSTKEKILNAAEHLFALHGYHSTSLRQITGRAKVNLAAVNYHFGSKKELISSVIARRLEPLNELRLARLQEVERNHEAAHSVSDILFAFVEPTIRFSESGGGAKNFTVLVGRILAEPDETARKIFLSHMRPVFHKLAALLSQALPHIPEDVLFCRMVFTFGVLGHAMNALDKCRAVAGGLLHGLQARDTVSLILPYVVGGMEAPL